MIAELQEVRYRYPAADRSVLDGISLQCEPSSFTLVVGKSGSGKSTLLRTLNGLVPHFSGGSFSGNVIVDQRNTRTVTPRDLVRAVGMVFQDPEAQLFTSRVDTEIAFSMEQLGIPRPEMQRRVEALLTALDIRHLRDRHPSRLSGGERQRVAIAAALAHNPRLLVLDEPTSQLDPWGADEVFQALDQVVQELGPAIVLAEHRLERSLPRAKTVVEVPGDGRIRTFPSAREAARQLDEVVLPPVTQLGRHLAWDRVPLSIPEARTQVMEAGFVPHLASAERNVPGEQQIAVRQLRVELDGRPVLADLSFEVSEGELIALMGRNGSGKTTLLRTLIGFQSPTQGHVSISGTDRPQANPAKPSMDVGFVPQQPGTMLFRETVAQELGSSLDLGLLEQLGLAAYLDRNPNDLSGGERERVALAMALAKAKRVLLLDEPTRGMDAWRKRDLVRHLKSLTARGVSVIVATHDVELAAQCADRIMVLDEGRLVADGLPAQVLGGTDAFTTQMQRVFGRDYLTVSDVLGDRESEPYSLSE